jgi:acetyl esterase
MTAGGADRPPSMQEAIRARGAVLDVAFAKSLYASALQNQNRLGVATEHDVAYGPDERHRLDVYRPSESARRTGETVVFLHGGGFVRGDKAERENIGYYFARQGIVTLVANYRLAPAHTWPAGAEDAARAVVWAGENGARWGADAQSLFLMGESAGAAHAALAALVRRFRPVGEGTISGVVLISGVYNARLEALARRQLGIATPDPRNEAYFGADLDAHARMSTIDLIDAPPLPVLITYAELDLAQMQVQAGELFARLVVRHGYEPDLGVIRGHNHISQLYAVNTGDESLTEPLLEFLRRHSAAPAPARDRLPQASGR